MKINSKEHNSLGTDNLDLKKRLKYFTNIDEGVSKIELYFKKHPELTQVPETKSLVYNRIMYPIIYEIRDFYYLGGKNLYFVLKSKCIIQKTHNSTYYEAFASEDDIIFGKSPIIPQGCPNNRGKVYPDDTVKLEIKV